jgi:hypothetical protein
MAIAATIIKAAARAVNVFPSGGDLTATEYATGLELLNDLLAQWSVESLLPVSETQENFTLVSGTGSYTIGSGADFNTARPVRVVDAFLRTSDAQDYPLQIIGQKDYDAISDKSTEGIPYRLFYKDAYSTGTVYLYFVPDAAYDLYLTTQKAFTALATTATTVSLPDEYVSALKPMLAVIWGNEFGRPAPQEVAALAAVRYRNLKRLNNSVPIADANPFVHRRTTFDIRRGY